MPPKATWIKTKHAPRRYTVLAMRAATEHYNNNHNKKAKRREEKEGAKRRPRKGQKGPRSGNV